MKGQPKYKLGDKVEFTLSDKTYTGIIHIVDEFGTWMDPSDVSYDIFVEKDKDIENCLVKHINEKLVIKKL